MTKYFDDMWLALDQELTHFDNYLGDKDWMSSTSSPESTPTSPGSDSSGVNLSPQTYDQLISQHDAPPPSNDQLRSRSRAERIEAVRQLYNKMPTIINAHSVATLHKVASQLYRKGYVGAANKILANEHAVFNKDMTYVEDDPDFTKSLEITRGDNKSRVSISVEDKATGKTYEKSFDNVLDAVKFLMKQDK